jgi:hypothetical protein
MNEIKLPSRAHFACQLQQPLPDHVHSVDAGKRNEPATQSRTWAGVQTTPMPYRLLKAIDLHICSGPGGSPKATEGSANEEGFQ